MTDSVDIAGLGLGFAHHAARSPDAVALVIGGRELTYGACDLTVRRWASVITEAAGGRPARVGVLGHRSETSYLAVLAALYSGAAFVPLNPKFPVARTTEMLRQAALDVLIVDESSLDLLSRLGADELPALFVPHLDEVRLPGGRRVRAADLSGHASLAPVRPKPEDAAYLLFTSGSTGRPKGVPVTHANVRSFLAHSQERYGVGPGDRLSQTFDQTFDLSVFDLFMAWEHGAAVCSMEAIELLGPAAYVERNGVTIWFSVPSVAAALLSRGALRPGSMPSLRWSLFCGEPLPVDVAGAWQEAAPRSVVENLYGPTELTIACAAHRWDPVRSRELAVHGNVPIGHVYPGLGSVLMDQDLRVVTDQGVGELCVSGAQTTPGYWNDPGLSAERYIEVGGTRFYRTGDIVRTVGPDDGYAYVGRLDDQVQLSGHRVELGEVEAALTNAGAVEAVCLTWPDKDTVTAVVSGGGGAEDELMTSVERILPTYMLPSRILRVRDMPRNGNGKKDRQAVRTWLDEQALGEVSFVGPAATEVEEVVARALGIPRATVSDSLRYQGIREWDSLGHISLVVSLEEAFGWRADDELTLHLRSVAAIKAYARDRTRAPAAPAATAEACEPGSGQVARGLDGVSFDRTSISRIDGDAGVLEYRGYDVDELVRHASFETVAHLLVHGEIPGPDALARFTRELAEHRQLPDEVLDLLHALRTAHPMTALLAAVPTFAAARGGGDPLEPQGLDEARDIGVRMIAAVPMMVAAHHAFRNGRRVRVPPQHLSYAGALMHALGDDVVPSDRLVRWIEQCLVLHADHGSNASAFAARVVTGTQGSMPAALTAAIAAFGGPVHGGAAERVTSLIDEVGTPAEAVGYVARAMRSRSAVHGFGHRVYRTQDPRVRRLRELAQLLSREVDRTHELEVLEAVVEAMRPYRRLGLAPNVDLYSGLVYRLMGIPDDLAVPMFVVGRTAGWVAQVLEQHADNVLIRPLLEYSGPPSRTLPSAGYSALHDPTDHPIRQELHHAP